VGGPVVVKKHAAGVLVLLALLAAVAESPALAQCPASALTFPTPGSQVTTSAPTFDVTSTDGSWVRGDHHNGVYSLHHSGYLAPTDLVARDLIDVTGVPVGTPVSVNVKVSVQGWVYTTGCSGTGCCGALVATARSGTDSMATEMTGSSYVGRGDFSGGVLVPIVIVAGTPREVEVEMWARRCPGGAHTVDATGQVYFEVTNPSATVTSCKGFGSTTVPVLRRSWGQLKSSYR
jgi:hypothetical protein